MLRAIFLANVFAMASVWQVPPARAAEPEIYYFGATGCGYCSNGLAFLKRLQKDDTRILLHDYDISANPDDATIFVRVVAAIGLSKPQVPLTVIGRHVIIGYEDDASTGNEIRQTVEQCRDTACPDLLRGLLTVESEVAVKDPQANWSFERRYAKSARDH